MKSTKNRFLTELRRLKIILDSPFSPHMRHDFELTRPSPAKLPL